MKASAASQYVGLHSTLPEFFQQVTGGWHVKTHASGLKDFGTVSHSVEKITTQWIIIPGIMYHTTIAWALHDYYGLLAIRCGQQTSSSVYICIYIYMLENCGKPLVSYM